MYFSQFSIANTSRPGRQQGNDGFSKKKPFDSARSQTSEASANARHANLSKPQANEISSNKKHVDTSKSRGFQFPVSIFFTRFCLLL